MHELWFITPAFRRFELTALCLDQRRRLCDELALAGIAATCVIVADDENLELARERGFETVERKNQWLGAKFSVGYLHALKHGATHLMPIGSDSWMHAGLILAMPFHVDGCTGSSFLSTVRADGRERLDMKISYAAGFGVATLYPRLAMKGNAWPCAPHIQRGCDTSTWNRTARTRGMGRPDFVSFHPHEYMDFKSYDSQVTDYRRLVHYSPEVTSGDAAIDELDRLYPGDLVGRLRQIYSRRPAWTT